MNTETLFINAMIALVIVAFLFGFCLSWALTLKCVLNLSAEDECDCKERMDEIDFNLSAVAKAVEKLEKAAATPPAFVPPPVSPRPETDATPVITFKANS